MISLSFNFSGNHWTTDLIMEYTFFVGFLSYFS
jgi:hypothetical protein